MTRGGMSRRAVPARFVASEWITLLEFDVASTFWRSNAGDARDYTKSTAAPRAQRFVSHSWSPPVDWTEVMGAQCV